MSIKLDSKLGVNLRTTFCPRCGWDTNELLLIGDRKYKYLCENGHRLFGFRRGEKCPCGAGVNMATRELIGENEKLPARQPCETCRKEIDEHKRIVEAGGVYWMCEQCRRGGVIRPNEFSAEVRETSGVEAPEPVCVKFSSCQQHATD